jgi:uncharacterized protein (UPF0335 family)
MDDRESKLYDQRTQEVQFLRRENQFLRSDRDHYRREWYFANERNNALKERIEKIEAENRRLKQQNKELTAAAPADGKPAPGFVKPAVGRRRHKKPGRKEGHPAALRPMPDHIDFHQEVALPVDAAGAESCPCCNTGLVDIEDHERVVEDIIPAKVEVTNGTSRRRNPRRKFGIEKKAAHPKMRLWNLVQARMRYAMSW